MSAGGAQGRRPRAPSRRPRGVGLALLIVGAALVLRQLGVGGLFFELVWLGAIFFAAAWTWRVVERRRPPRPAGKRGPDRAMVLIVGAFGFFALLTLQRLAGAAFLGSLALFFWLLFTSPSTGRRRAPGLAIAAGVLTTLALVAGVSGVYPRWGDSGVIFFLGMTGTFTFVYLLPREQGGARWALWPALAWAALTLVVNDPFGGLARWMLPLALIGVGAVWLGYTRGRR